MLSKEALTKILAEADRIIYDAQDLLHKAIETGHEELIEAATKNLYQVIENRQRLTKAFSLKSVR